MLIIRVLIYYYCWNNDSSDDEGIWERFDYDSENDSNQKEIIDNNDDDFNYLNSSQAFNDNNSCCFRIKTKKNRPKKNDSNDFQVGSEFDITPEFLAALLASERQHRNEITR